MNGPATGRPASVPAAWLAVVLLWSTTPLAINWSLEGGSFAFAVFSRMLVGLVCAVLVLLATGVGFPLRREVWPAYLVGGTSLFGTMLCTYWGAQFVPSGLISVLFGLSPLVTSVIAAVWLGEKSLPPLRLAGMGLAVAGLVVVFGHGDDLGGPNALLGLAAVLLAVLINSLGLVGMKRAAGTTPPLAITAGVMLVSVPLFGLACLATGAHWPDNPPLRSVLAILYLGVFGSVLGFALYYFLLKHLEAATLSLTLVVTPMFALFLGRLLNNEALPAQAWIGAAMISAGLLLHQQGLPTIRRRQS